MIPIAGSTAVDFESRLIAFEEAWRSETPPDLDGFLTPASAAGDDAPFAARVRELRDLIPMDLEYRWREPASRLKGSLPPRPRLEDYRARYPELSRPAGSRRNSSGRNTGSDGSGAIDPTDRSISYGSRTWLRFCRKNSVGSMRRSLENTRATIRS